MCAACGSEMKIVSVITEPDVIDAILSHLAKTGGRDPFEGRPRDGALTPGDASSRRDRTPDRRH